MRRAGNLYMKIAEPENLRLAFWKAQKGKQTKPDVRLFAENLEENLTALRRELLSGKVQVGNYHYFTIYDPKERVICAASFRERVLHHAVINVCEPYFEAYQIRDSYACRKGKGLDAAIARLQEFCGSCGWYLKLDVHKYFDTISHEILFHLLCRRFKDKALLCLMEQIIESYETLPGRGIPIGNLTSQYFANLYLGRLDHYVKETLRIRGYLRYMDDFVLLGDSREELKECYGKVKEFLSENLGLELNEPKLNRSRDGVPYLGYKVRQDRFRLSARAKRRFTLKYKQAEQNLSHGTWSQSVYSDHILPLLAFVQRADSKGFLYKVMGDREGISSTREGSNRVIRGGSWNNNANNCRSANRNNNNPDNNWNNNGFRVALSSAQEDDGCRLIEPEDIPVLSACGGMR